MKKRAKTIIVNATALTSGGALTILEIFLDEIKETKQNYYIFVSLHLKDSFYKKSNIKIFGVDTSSAFKRIHWDWFGLGEWVRLNKITPDVVLSLQNTSINLKGARQFIYLHQAVALHPAKWSFLKKDERKLAFYKYVYPFFIKCFIKNNTTFLVQTNWMKTACAKRFKTSNIKILPPNLSNYKTDYIQPINLTFKYSLFYPANASIFKNHIELIKALYEIKKENPKLSIGLYLTLFKQDNPKLVKLIAQYNLMSNVIFLGTISKETMKRFYKSCSVLVFPSYIESFGLPLVEIQSFQKPIIVADEPYAKEVLKNYPLAFYAKRNLTDEWKQRILEVAKLNNKYKNKSNNYNNSFNNNESTIDSYVNTETKETSFEDVLLKE